MEGKKLIREREALFVIQGLKRFRHDEEKLEKFVKSHVLRLLKMDKIAVLNELERQEEVCIALKMFRIIQKEEWYTPDVYLYKDLIIALARAKKKNDGGGCGMESLLHHYVVSKTTSVYS
ncbi:hypothetical protein HPP92_007879 [Vanilla planifolia]|uniref:Uncharacterized protein n=1 Tax=Vanilla planifolia TaxID=51239 RepID=A0A835RF19_VANPL|nr:hypothetical protein HPP92_007879 [Vanilla planifolia]